MNVQETKEQLIAELIRLAFAEDIGDGDHTTLCCIPATKMGKSQLIVKEDGVLAGVEGINLRAALALSLGIAIQNFPEGAIISMPLHAMGMTRNKAFWYGTFSGAVEPVGALLTIFATGLIVPILPYLLSFAAGAMMYVVVEELIPEMSEGEHSNIGSVTFAIGFAVMMALDVALG